MRTESKKDYAYKQIKDRIITCEYAPGMLLSEAMVMEDINYSRTPIREALNMLEQENLIIIIPKKGIMVSSVSLKDIIDVYHVRLMLEPHIIQTWGSEIPKDKLLSYREHLVTYTEDATLEERRNLDNWLHRMIIGSCPNIYLSQMSNRLLEQNQRISLVVGQLTSRMVINVQSHLIILDDLLAGDYTSAAKAMYEHIEEGRNAAIAALNAPSKGIS